MSTPEETSDANKARRKRRRKLPAVPAKALAISGTSGLAVCQQTRTLRVPYHNKADGFFAALVLTLNQVKFCERHSCQPFVTWGAYPACKYPGVRNPGRTPFYEASAGPNAFEYFFQPVCDGPPAQEGAPIMSCEQREMVHRELAWSVRTYPYGKLDGGGNSSAFDEAWYGGMRREGARLVAKYLRLQPALSAKFEETSLRLLGRSGAREGAPVIGVHMRGTDKGRYLQTAGSGAQVRPDEYTPYVLAFLSAHPNGTVYVATDSPSFLEEARAKWPSGRLRYRDEVLRVEGNVAFTSDGTPQPNKRKGEEVLLDALLLSRTDYLLHSASGVAEFAIYFNPSLHESSVHLQYAKRRRVPAWMRGRR